MEKKSSSKFRFLAGLGLVIIGIILFAVSKGTIRYIGLVFIIISFLYVLSSFIPKNIKSEEDNFKSPTREKIRNHRNKRS